MDFVWLESGQTAIGQIYVYKFDFFKCQNHFKGLSKTLKKFL